MWARDVLAAPEPDRPNGDAARLRSQLAKVIAKRTRLATALAEGHMDPGPYTAADRPYAEQQAALEARLADAAVPAVGRSAAESVPSLLADWHLLSGAERAAVLRAFGGRVTVWRGPKVEVRWGATDKRRGPKPA